jgi:tetratricopeptide (TPR) repeat protein
MGIVRSHRGRMVFPATFASILAAVLATAASTSAFAQSSALGGGRALDRNLQRGVGRINPAAAQPDYRARNEDVTGTLAGGRSFRGDVGYRPSGDFAGAVGSDALYGSLRYSAYSDPLLFTSPMRNDQFRVAEGMGIYQFRRDFAALPVYSGTAELGGLVERQIRLDRSNAALMTGNLYGTAVSISQLGLLEEAEQGPSVVYASPLQGVRSQSLADPLLQAGLSPFERSLAIADLDRRGDDAAGVGEPYRSALSPSLGDSIRADARFAASDEAVLRQVERRLVASNVDPLQAREIVSALRDDLSSGRIRGGGEVADFVEGRLGLRQPRGRFAADADGTDRTYERIVQRVIEQYADKADYEVDGSAAAEARIREEMELLRRGLRGDEPVLPDAAMVDLPGASAGDRSGDGDGDGDAAAGPGGTPPLPPVVRPEPRRDPDDASRPSTVPPERTLSIEQMAEVLRHGRRVESLGDGELDRFNQLLAEGQALLAEGEFFRAERRFENALRLQPEHPLASAGLAHAQAGAGLYLSAGLTLRRLFTENPEMIDVRYAEGLLPPRARLEAVVEALRRRIDQGRDIAGYGLLLAYLGHQFGDREIVREGLRTIDGSGDERIEPLAQLLHAVWLAPAADADEGK